MSTIKQLKKKSVKETEAFLSDGISIIQGIDATIQELLSFKPSEVSKFEEATEAELISKNFAAENSVLAKALPKTRDLVAAGISHILLLENFISLHIPAMEDGNNFGVSVQMVVSKALKEQREKWEKLLDISSGYYSSRAEAVSKLDIKKPIINESKTTTSTSKTGGKDGDESTTSTVATKEEKSTGTNDSNSCEYHRVKHLLSLDTKCYLDLYSALISLKNGYILIIDNMEKNKEKLLSPKGSGGGGISMSMY